MASRARWRLRWRVAIATLFALLLVGAGVFLWQWRERGSEPPLPPVLRVGIDPSIAPFAYFVGDQVVGIEPALATAISERLHLPLQLVPLGFDGLYDALAADRADLILAFVTVDPNRLDRVRYTPAYFNAGLVMISDARAAVGNMRAVAGGRLAYAFGSSAQTEAGQWARRIAAFEALPYELPQYALDAVRLGQADAALVDAVSARLYASAHPVWTMHMAEITVVPIAAAMRTDRPRLAREVDRIMADMLTDGTVDALMQLGFEQAANINLDE